MTSGWPLGSTCGPWREWQDMMSTSAGSQRSKAAISGSLHDVWPPTMAPTLVAVSEHQGSGLASFSKAYENEMKRKKKRCKAWESPHTLAVHLHHGVYCRGFDVVQDVIACSGYEGAVTANLYVVLYCDKELQYMPPSSTGRSMFSYISCKFFLQGFDFCVIISITGEDSKDRGNMVSF